MLSQQSTVNVLSANSMPFSLDCELFQVQDTLIISLMLASGLHSTED